MYYLQKLPLYLCKGKILGKRYWAIFTEFLLISRNGLLRFLNTTIRHEHWSKTIYTPKSPNLSYNVYSQTNNLKYIFESNGPPKKSTLSALCSHAIFIHASMEAPPPTCSLQVELPLKFKCMYKRQFMKHILDSLKNIRELLLGVEFIWHLEKYLNFLKLKTYEARLRKTINNI